MFEYAGIDHYDRNILFLSLTYPPLTNDKKSIKITALTKPAAPDFCISFNKYNHFRANNIY